MRTFDAVVLESVVETPDTRTLVLDLGSPAAYRAGQYVSIDPHQFVSLRGFTAHLEQLKGRREAPRAYSMCSAPHEPHLAITIKEEVYEAGRTLYPPLLSGFLVHQVRAGDRLVVTGCTGAYTLPEDIEARTDHVLHLCAGSGSVPNFSMLKDSLQRHSRLRHTFVYSNRTVQDIIFHDALERLSAQQPRLRLLHGLTREAGALPHEGMFRGRVDQDLLQSIIAAESSSLVYACGPAVTVWERRACKAQGIEPPPRFMESMLGHLEALGVPRTRIKVEAFG